MFTRPKLFHWFILWYGICDLSQLKFICQVSMLFTVDVKEQERNGKVNRKQFLELEIWFILILRLYGGDHHHHSWLCDFGPTLAIKPPSRLNANLPGTKLSLVFTAVGNISDTGADKILMVRPRAVSSSFGKQVDNSQRKGGDWVQPTISFPWELKKTKQ